MLLMNILMNDIKIASKLLPESSDDKKKSYPIIDISQDGTVTLGETKFRMWNNLVKCQVKIPFAKWALCVWDALIDMATGENREALQKGLSQEIAERAQREGEYDWVVARLYNCYCFVCDNRSDVLSPEGGPEKSGRKVINVEKIRTEQPVNINVNFNGRTKTLRFPDSMGNAHLEVEMGVVGVNTVY